MAFRFKFPTLKQLAMLNLGRHYINNNVLSIDEFFHISFLSKESFERVHDIVEHTQLPSKLKRELIPVLTGIYCNLGLWKHGVDNAVPNVNINEYVLDVHGQLNDQKTWRQYFDAKLGQVGDEHELMILLEVAIKQSLVPQIDKVLKLLVHLFDGGERQTDLEGPGLLLPRPFEGDFLAYCSNKDLNEQLILQLNSSRHVWADRKSIIFLLYDTQLSFLWFKNHYNLLDEHERASYFESSIQALLNNKKTSIIVKVLQFVEEKYHQHLKSIDLRMPVLKSFLDWPYNQFFLPTLKDMNTVMGRGECCMLLDNFAARMPPQQHHDAGYADLLVVFLQNSSPEIRQLFRYGPFNLVDIVNQ